MTATVQPPVTLDTKCYERDWRYLLKKGGLGRLVESSGHIFDRVQLVINNVADEVAVVPAAEKLRTAGLLTDIHLVSQDGSRALAMAQVTREELGAGYVYSIAELVGVERCSTAHLCHLAGDVVITDSSGWVGRGIRMLERHPGLAVVNPVWNSRLEEVHKEAEDVHQEPPYVLGYGFSDQCFLVRASEFAAPIYSVSHAASARYPAFGGELFEKRVDSWMRVSDQPRATDTLSDYSHDSDRYRSGRQGLLARLRLEK